MFHNFDINQMVIMVVSLLFAVTVHEAAHGYVAHIMGDNTAKLAGRLTLNPVKHLDFIGSILMPVILVLAGSPFVFGYAKPVPVNFANLRDVKKGVICVSSAGVLANFSLAVLFSISFKILIGLEPVWYGSIFKPLILDLLYFSGFSVIVNTVLAIFNLIPIPPLDGSRILSMLLPADIRMLYARIERFGIIIIFFLLMTDFFNQIISFIINPLVNLLLGRYQ